MDKTDFSLIRRTSRKRPSEVKISFKKMPQNVATCCNSERKYANLLSYNSPNLLLVYFHLYMAWTPRIILILFQYFKVCYCHQKYYGFYKNRLFFGLHLYSIGLYYYYRVYLLFYGTYYCLFCDSDILF